MKKLYLLILLCTFQAICLADWLNDIGDFVIVQNNSNWPEKEIKAIVKAEIDQNYRLISDLEQKSANWKNLGIISKASLKAQIIKAKAQRSIHLRVLKNLDRVSNNLEDQEKLIKLFKEIKELENNIKELEANPSLINRTKARAHKARLVLKRRYVKTILEM